MLQLPVEQAIDGNEMSKMFPNCSDCDCYTCLHYRSGRCACYDDIRSKIRPREKETGEHWTGWSKCEEPGEQDHWCRGGILTPQHGKCQKYVRVDEEKIIVQDCLKAVIIKYQDGYIRCSLLENLGCEKCYREWEKRNETD